MASDKTHDAPLAWFRPSIRKPVLRAWLQAVSFVLMGSLVLGLLRVQRVDFGSPWLPVYFLGVGCVMCGPLWLATRLQRILRSERVLVLGEGGIHWLEGEAVSWSLRWEELERIELVEMQLRLSGSAESYELSLPFDGVEGPELVATLEDLRRKKLLGVPLKLRADRM